jgi:MFS family permease
VAPAALAYVADRCQDPDLRAKRFAWINGAVFAGYLGGPLIGVLAGRIDVHAPFLLPAVAAAGAALLALFACRGAQLRPIPAHFPWRARLAPLAYLLGVSAVAAGGVVALEIAVTLPLSQTASGRGSAALLLSLCGAVMFLTQMVLFSGHDAARRATRLIRPLLAGLAATLLVAPFVQGLWLLAGVVAITASAAATLNVLASYLTSRLSPSAHGLGLGLQYAAVSAGQMMAALAAGPSAAAGVPYALWFAGAAAVGLAMIPATAPNPEAR